MEDEVLLGRPTDRRLVGDNSSLPPGPPGAENDSFDLVQNDTQSQRKDQKVSRDPRRRSPPPSPRDRRSRSRGKRRSRSRGRDYSPPDRRRFNRGGGRRSRDRIIRSPPDHTRNRSRERVTRRRLDRSRSRERYRGRRSRSRSNSPLQRRWSPMAKPPSPAMPPPPPQYSVPPPPPQYDAYGQYANQYIGQFPAYDYANQMTVQVPYAAAYPCDPQAWTQPPPQQVQQPQQPPVPQPPQITTVESDEDQMKRDAAIAQEAQNQRDQLKKQRSEYLKRSAALKREMKILKEQRSDLVSTNGPPSPTTKGFLDENDRLQSQIQKKLSTIENVIDMLSSIIGEEPELPESPQPKKPRKKSATKIDGGNRDENDDDDSSSSPERLKTKLIESMKTKREGVKKPSDTTGAATVKVEKIKEESATKTQSEPAKKINYSFYDPEMHWCTICDVFPKTAKDYLNHLHTAEHASNVLSPETPWHESIVNDEFPNFSNAPTKRTPIRGLQFFVASTGWFCKLCNFWMGDLHCASSHLKSRSHSDKYNIYIEQNPHFEVDWMADRQKVLDNQRTRESNPPPPPQITPVVSTTGMDLLESIPLQINNQKVTIDLEKSKKKKKKTEEKKEKKKKKRSKKRKKESSSSSSSSSDSSSDSEKEKKQKDDPAGSIRVAMRNLLKKDEFKEMDDGTRGKWTTIEKGNDAVNGSASIIAKPPEPEPQKKDELISQWNTLQPIISESEKKLLEDLKGKLKTKTTDAKKPESSDSKKRDRSSERVDAKSKQKRSGSTDRKSPNRDRTEKRNKSQDREVKSNDKSRDVTKRSKSRSRSRDRRSRSADIAAKGRGDRRRSKSRDRRSRSRGRVRRSRSRNRGRGRISPDRRRHRSRSLRRSRSPRRRSRSPSNRYPRRRSYSRSRSRSRSRSHRIEKPIVRYPEFRPRVPPPEPVKKSSKKSEIENDRKKTPPQKKSQSATGSGKKLPFIGRMPVFKKQTQGADGEKKEDETNEDSNMEPFEVGYQQYDGYHPQMDYDDLMPDPMQFVTLMGAPPPPPSAPPPMNNNDDKEEMLPPGIDESESDAVPKPINDAPMARKGPLPRDFEEALNIIFPGEKKPDEPEATGKANATEAVDHAVALEIHAEVEVPPTMEEMSIDANSIQTGDDISQQSMAEGFLGFAQTAVAVTYGDMAQDVPDLTKLINAVPPPPPPPPPESKEENGSVAAAGNAGANDDGNGNAESKEDLLRRQEELDDLAMLGIDADDLAAQCM